MRALLMLLAGLAATLAAAQAATSPGASVLTYHGDPQRSGNFVEPTLGWRAAGTMHRDAAFDGAVDGHVYAQPLYWHPPGGERSELIVATENDVVQALDPASGRTLWRAALGTPVRRSELPCGDIDPEGITGTPVIDPATGSLYLDAVVNRDGAPVHEVFGLSLADGHVLAGWPVDVQAALHSRGIQFVPPNQDQRAALALLGGRVFVAFGGNWGDCKQYHGIVLGLGLAPPHDAVGWSTRGLKGGIWAPGGIASDGGSLFVSTGNTTTDEWGDGEAVFRLAPDLAHSLDPRNFYAPRNWKQLDEDDLDMSGVSPLPFNVGGAHRVVALGKDGNAYLLDRSNLGGMGGQIAIRRVAGIPIITGPAVYPDGRSMAIAFRAPAPVCPHGQSGNVEAIAVSRSAIAPLWCAALDGKGSAIVTTTDGASQPTVWVAGAEGDDRLHAFRGDTGAPLWTSKEQLPGLRHFVTPVVAGSRLYIAGDGRIYAFGWNRD